MFPLSGDQEIIAYFPQLTLRMGKKCGKDLIYLIVSNKVTMTYLIQLDTFSRVPP